MSLDGEGVPRSLPTPLCIAPLLIFSPEVIFGKGFSVSTGS
nr:MAG TPA: hypothetical protein [Caudoviricetes sp.]DAX23535.1 MAG TPA: hypothetical protein [Caudoviricetes sp.]